MTLDLARIRCKFPFFQLPATRTSRTETVFSLDVEFLSPMLANQISKAELVLTRGFPGKGKARIRLSNEAVFRIPHVDEDGWVCLGDKEDPGPAYDCSPDDRVILTLFGFQNFVRKWCLGELDGDFDKEPLNYWFIRANKEMRKDMPVRTVWTTDERPGESSIREGTLVLPERILIVGDDRRNRALIRSLEERAKQEVTVRVADVLIDRPLVPAFWPKSDDELERLLICRLSSEDQHRFLLPKSERKKGRGQHRVVVLRHTQHSYAFLLPGGPYIDFSAGGKNTKYKPLRVMSALNVERLDPCWTVGRDQHPIVLQRQQQRVLVIGVGALGSPVADHLAKAGFGQIVLVDNDMMEPANLGRHLLGAESLKRHKADAVAKRLSLAYPATQIKPVKNKIENWLETHRLDHYDLVLDLTGAEEVRRVLDKHRNANPCPLVVAWMEPFVAAAHACLLPPGVAWIHEGKDFLKLLQAVDWPDTVIQEEPGCSTKFQSYTASAAAYAVAMVAEKALEALDSGIEKPVLYSWVRNQAYLDKMWNQLALRGWAKEATTNDGEHLDGVLVERSFPASKE